MAHGSSSRRPIATRSAITPHFDTVYVSMYKYFNAASGAVLAGPKALLENLFSHPAHVRRRIASFMALCAVALHYFDAFGSASARPWLLPKR